MRTKKPWLSMLALLTAFTLVAAACGDDSEDSSTGSSDSSETTAGDDTSTTADGGTDTTMDGGTDTTMGSGEVAEPVGAACSAIPADGEGSSAGMADDTAGTAASNNPVLSTLVDAVTAADLVDALNDPAGEYTIFAPANSAFDKIPADTLNGLLEPGQKDALTDILTYHVFAEGKMDLAQLQEAGELTMLNGDTVTVEGSGDTLTINGESMVVCGNVTTANATVQIIDTVLMPPA